MQAAAAAYSAYWLLRCVDATAELDLGQVALAQALVLERRGP
jgi:hypothetical protein